MSAGRASLRVFIRRHVFALKRSWQTEEPYWFWTWGRWEFQAGVFHGFGLGVVAFRDQFGIELGPFGLHGDRRDNE